MAVVRLAEDEADVGGEKKKTLCHGLIVMFQPETHLRQGWIQARVRECYSSSTDTDTTVPSGADTHSLHHRVFHRYPHEDLLNLYSPRIHYGTCEKMNSKLSCGSFKHGHCY